MFFCATRNSRSVQNFFFDSLLCYANVALRMTRMFTRCASGLMLNCALTYRYMFSRVLIELSTFVRYKTREYSNCA